MFRLLKEIRSEPRLAEYIMKSNSRLKIENKLKNEVNSLPSTSIAQSRIKSLHADINRLRKALDKEKKNEADSLKNKMRAMGGIKKNSSQSTINSKLRVADNEEKKRAKAVDQQYKISKKITEKEVELSKKQQELVKIQIKSSEQLQKSQEDTLKKVEKFQETFDLIQNEYENKLSLNREEIMAKDFDVFISHASEDKTSFVKPLVTELTNEKVSFFYDDLSIGWGKSVRQSLDEGILRSKFCVVVISKPFLEKYWTNYELDGFLQKEAKNRTTVVLPIWLNITHDEVYSVSPTLANRRAIIGNSLTVEEIVEGIKNVLESGLESI